MDLEYVDKIFVSQDLIDSLPLGTAMARDGFTKTDCFNMNVFEMRSQYIREDNKAIEAKTDYYSAKLVGDEDRMLRAKVRCWDYHTRSKETLNKLYNYKTTGDYYV